MAFKVIFIACLLWLVLSVGKINILKEEITQAKQNIKKLEEEMMSVLEDIVILRNQRLGCEEKNNSLIKSLILITKKPIDQQEGLIDEFLVEKPDKHCKVLIEEQMELSKKITSTKKLEYKLVKKMKKINSSFWLDPLNAGKKWN